MNAVLDLLAAMFVWVFGPDTVDVAERIGPHVPRCPFFVAEADDPDVCCYCDEPRARHSARALAFA